MGGEGGGRVVVVRLLTVKPITELEVSQQFDQRLQNTINVTSLQYS